MEAIEFKAKIKNGIIRIPKKYIQQVGDTVKVIILSDHKLTHKDMVDELLNHPVKVDKFVPFSRDEIYERY